MYELRWDSESVKKKVQKALKKLRSNPQAQQEARNAIESLKTNPRSFTPGNKHQLTGDRRGMWALTLTDKLRLTYIIHDNVLVVVAMEVEDYHPKH